MTLGGEARVGAAALSPEPVGRSATVGEMLAALAETLAGPLVPAARQEARDLIAAVLDVPRFWPSANSGRALSDDERARIDDAASRLMRGMPLAYAARRAAFRTLSLFVDERVLIPRPETEVLVDQVLDAMKGGSGIAIDVGTGSGCIALALAVEGKFARVIGTDVSPQALEVARMNGELRTANSDLRAGRGATPVEFRCGSFLAPCRGERASVIVANPPYISEDEREELPALVRDWEPAGALFAGDGGMSAIRAIAHEAVSVLEPGGLLALEVDSRRAERALEIVEAVGAYRDGALRPDLTGRARFVLARRSEA